MAASGPTASATTAPAMTGDDRFRRVNRCDRIGVVAMTASVMIASATVAPSVAASFPIASAGAASATTALTITASGTAALAVTASAMGASATTAPAMRSSPIVGDEVGCRHYRTTDMATIASVTDFSSCRRFRDAVCDSGCSRWSPRR
jgi:hypothetical protein